VVLISQCLPQILLVSSPFRARLHSIRVIWMRQSMHVFVSFLPCESNYEKEINFQTEGNQKLIVPEMIAF